MYIAKMSRFLLISGAALALAACGEQGDGPEAQPAPSGPTAAETQAALGAGGAPGDSDEAIALDLDEAASADPSMVNPGSPESPDGPTPELDRDTYRVRVVAPDTGAEGEEGVTAIHVEPKDGWRMNHDFPMRLVVEAPDGVAVEGAEQEIPDAVHYSDERGEWAVRFTPEGSGEKTFEADFRFAVCTDEVCIPKREKLAWIVEVD